MTNVENRITEEERKKIGKGKEEKSNKCSMH